MRRTNPHPSRLFMTTSARRAHGSKAPITATSGSPPSTIPAWAPYTRNGHWVYANVGWTWVSDEPWGWATYHYGRWVNLDGTGWCWVPGYTWAPAWVSWRYGGGYCGLGAAAARQLCRHRLRQATGIQTSAWAFTSAATAIPTTAFAQAGTISCRSTISAIPTIARLLRQSTPELRHHQSHDERHQSQRRGLWRLSRRPSVQSRQHGRPFD